MKQWSDGFLRRNKNLACGYKRPERTALSLPDVVMCYDCNEVVPIAETTRAYRPDEDSQYHRICKNCQS